MGKVENSPVIYMDTFASDMLMPDDITEVESNGTQYIPWGG